MSQMQQLGKVIAKALATGAPGAVPRNLGEALSSHPPSVTEIVQLMFKEARRKRSNPQLLHAFGLMLAQALEAARWRQENGSIVTHDLAEIVRAAVVQEQPGEKDADAFFAISRSFSAAKVELGDELGSLMEMSFASSVPPIRSFHWMTWSKLLAIWPRSSTIIAF